MTKPYKKETGLSTIWENLTGTIKVLSVFAAIILCLTTISSLLGGGTGTDFELEKDLVREQNFTSGLEGSDVKFLYFYDLQCPACKAFHPTLNSLKDEYSDRVEFVYKNNPLESIHIFAKQAARGAHAAQKQDKYVEFIDIVYERQDELGNRLLEEIATELGLDVSQWKLDLRDKEIDELIEFDQKDLEQTFFPESSVSNTTKPVGEISGTPTIVLTKNDEVVDWWTGGQTQDQVGEKLDKLLAE